jgi:hypothetical protein
MALTLIGWLFLVVLLACISAVVIALDWDSLGQYNIGAVENSFMTKFIAVAITLIVIAAWYWIFKIAPFEMIQR